MQIWMKAQIYYSKIQPGFFVLIFNHSSMYLLYAYCKMGMGDKAMIKWQKQACFPCSHEAHREEQETICKQGQNLACWMIMRAVKTNGAGRRHVRKSSQFLLGDHCKGSVETSVTGRHLSRDVKGNRKTTKWVSWQGLRLRNRKCQVLARASWHSRSSMQSCEVKQREWGVRLQRWPGVRLCETHARCIHYGMNSDEWNIVRGLSWGVTELAHLVLRGQRSTRVRVEGGRGQEKPQSACEEVMVALSRHSKGRQRRGQLKAYSEDGERGFVDRERWGGERGEVKKDHWDLNTYQDGVAVTEKGRPRESRFRGKSRWFGQVRCPLGNVLLTLGVNLDWMERFGMDRCM